MLHGCSWVFWWRARLSVTVCGADVANACVCIFMLVPFYSQLLPLFLFLFSLFLFSHHACSAVSVQTSSMKTELETAKSEAETARNALEEQKKRLCKALVLLLSLHLSLHLHCMFHPLALLPYTRTHFWVHCSVCISAEDIERLTTRLQDTEAQNKTLHLHIDEMNTKISSMQTTRSDDSVGAPGDRKEITTDIHGRTSERTSERTNERVNE